MRTNKRPSYLDLVEDINNTYGEWLEMGYDVDRILLSLLHKERENNYNLQNEVDYLRKKASILEKGNL